MRHVSVLYQAVPVWSAPNRFSSIHPPSAARRVSSSAFHERAGIEPLTVRRSHVCAVSRGIHTASNRDDGKTHGRGCLKTCHTRWGVSERLFASTRGSPPSRCCNLRITRFGRAHFPKRESAGLNGLGCPAPIHSRSSLR